MLRSYFTIALALSPLAFTACSREKPQTESATAGTTVHPMRGIVREIRPAEDTVIIEHEDVPGYMPSMTMPFNIRDAAEFGKIHPGSAIAFELVTTQTESWIRGIKDVPAASLKLPEPKPALKSTASTRVREGDAMLEFQLTDQHGKTFDKATFAGKNLLVTFIFTRCAVPDFCPRMSEQFSELEKSVLADPALKDKVRLLSISFDPAFDTPAVLTDYAGNYATKDAGIWSFATGSEVQIDKLIKAFAVHTELDGGTISHGLCTAWIAPDGTIRQIWRGNAWKPAEVIEAVRSNSPKQ